MPLNPSTLQVLGAVLFAVAVAHTFSTAVFERLARSRPAHAGLWHLLGEVEVAFGFWAMVLVLAMMFIIGPGGATEYLETRNFTEPMFVFAIMVVAASRPILALASRITSAIAATLPMQRSSAFYFTSLSFVPLLGSFITEPAAMTLAALILRERYYRQSISAKLKYATLGVLFVNVSIGGALTPYAAPPVLRVAKTWGWDLEFMLATFGWKVALAVAVNALGATLLFRRELARLPVAAVSRATSVPFPIVAAHLFFLVVIVAFAHHAVVFMGALLFFLGFASAYEKHQDRLILREGLLVAFFLAGLVVLGGQQRWWLDPLLQGMDATSVYYGAVALTAVTDNAALTYLGSLVHNVDDAFKYALVAGAITGGGLTIIANAPNPAGFAVLRDHFDGSINPLGLLAAALPPTLVAIAAFRIPLAGEQAMQQIFDLWDWAAKLDPAAAFLLLVPFAVAGAGLLQWWLERGDKKPRDRGHPVFKS